MIFCCLLFAITELTCKEWERATLLKDKIATRYLCGQRINNSQAVSSNFRKTFSLNTPFCFLKSHHYISTQTIHKKLSARWWKMFMVQFLATSGRVLHQCSLLISLIWPCNWCDRVSSQLMLGIITLHAGLKLLSPSTTHAAHENPN